MTRIESRILDVASQMLFKVFSLIRVKPRVNECSKKLLQAMEHFRQTVISRVAFMVHLWQRRVMLASHEPGRASCERSDLT